MFFERGCAPLQCLALARISFGLSILLVVHYAVRAVTGVLIVGVVVLDSWAYRRPQLITVAVAIFVGDNATGNQDKDHKKPHIIIFQFNAPLRIIAKKTGHDF